MNQSPAGNSAEIAPPGTDGINLSAMRQAACAASELLKNLANDHRLIVLCMLAEREMSVSEISEHVDLGQSPLSQHLARLRADGLVKTRKVAQHVYYSLDSEEAKAVIQTLYRLYCGSGR
jgi:DNA-binding transcriptional ArsR family regulator